MVIWVANKQANRREKHMNDINNQSNKYITTIVDINGLTQHGWNTLGKFMSAYDLKEIENQYDKDSSIGIRIDFYDGEIFYIGEIIKNKGKAHEKM